MRATLPRVWCVRADFGTYAQHFLKGGYFAVDYGISSPLSDVKDKETIDALFRKEHPSERSSIVIGQQVGQVARFLLDIKAGDYVITPSPDIEKLHFGVVDPGEYTFEPMPRDGCRFRHRRAINWSTDTIYRSMFSVPFQNTIRSSLTVFAVSHTDEFFRTIKLPGYTPENSKAGKSNYEVILDQILELTAGEFEQLVGHLLVALGFEEKEVTGKSGDGGVDVTGVLSVANLVKVKLFVQAKRYKQGAKISANVVRSLRAAIPVGAQAAFITTADFQAAAHGIANEQGFTRIGLINGNQLVELLVQNWGEIPPEFQDRLGLRMGLVLNQ
jgi:predicted Mrr-cat superfamily restriction endonuclease